VRPAARPVFSRAILLLVLLVCLDLWASRHLGIGLSRRPAWLGLITASWVAAASVLDRVLEDEEKKSAAKRTRDALRRLLATPVLVALALLLAVLALSYSSVRVLGSAEARGAKLDPVEPEQHPGWTVRGEPGRFVVPSRLTSGRVYRLSVPGYLPTVLTVPALIGREILPERDLRKSPTLLLRPLPTTLGSFGDGGRLEVWAPYEPRPIASSACDCRASFLLGRRQPIPSDALSRWSLELRALNAAPEGSSLLSETLLVWSRPRPLALSRDLRPGDPLDIRVFSKAGNLIARTPFTVTEESFQDILLLVE
jgi:hypothetical protein